MTTPCCGDIAIHSHDGGTTLRKAGQPYAIYWSKTWRRPFLHTYIAAPPRRLRITRNRYGTSSPKPVTIGVAVQVGRRVLSLVWAQPIATGRVEPARP